MGYTLATNETGRGALVTPDPTLATALSERTRRVMANDAISPDPGYPDEHEVTQWELWSRYVAGVDALHEAELRADDTGRVGYIYIAHMVTDGVSAPDGSGHYKIGRARNPKARIESWSKTPVKMPFRIFHFHSFWARDAIATEHCLHRMFQKHRVSGEWFCLPFHVQMALADIWYAASWRTLDGIEFRSSFGEWDTALDFVRISIAHQLDEERRNRERREQRTAGD